MANRENVALAVAAAAMRTVPAEEHRYVRFVWVTDRKHETWQGTSLAMNMLSQRPNIRRPEKVELGETLAMVNLSHYAGGEKLDKLVRDWEEFRFDWRFNLLLTEETIEFAVGEGVPRGKKEWAVVEVPPFLHSDGKTYTKKWVERDNPLGDKDVVRVVGEHVDRRLMAEMIDRTGSQAPVVSHKYFVWRALSTIKDDEPYATLFGGLYYDLAGIPQKSKKGSDKDNLLQLLGVGSVEAGITSKVLFDRLESDQKTAVFRSEVTGSERAIEYLRTLAAKDSQSIAVFTLDVKRRSSVNIAKRAMMNLIAFKPDGSEGIFEKSNGLQGYVIFDDKDNLLQSVASDIACDRTVPAPHSTDLQGPIGCIRCHGPEGGWRISRNDVKTLTGGKLDIIDDLNFRNELSRKKNFGYKKDLFERLAGLYSGDLEFTVLPRAREDYARAVLRATGPWKDSKTQTDVVKLASAKLGAIYAEAAYNSVTAMTVTEDLGIPCKDNKEAAAVLTKLLPPIPTINPNSYGIEEDPNVKALAKGMAINPVNYALVYSFIAKRAQDTGMRLRPPPLIPLPKQRENQQ